MGGNSIITGEQSDGSLILNSGEIITEPERRKIISNSISLPVREYEKEIKNIIQEKGSFILIGETGSGKTTELAQMIHELYKDDIVITDIPLVAATIGTASYVSKIMYCKEGNPYYDLGNGGVGYRTGKGVSEDFRTQIGFHTYGLDYLYLSLGNLEKKLNSTNKIIHIILDEIHEKSEDFIFYFSRILELRKKYPKRLNIYGASATISDNYLDKLLDDKRGFGSKTEVIKVKGRTYSIIDEENNGGEISLEVEKLYKKGKSILVFQPGKPEIEKLIGILKNKLGEEISIFPFHGEVSEQELKSNLERSGEQTIIVATNAARTGITLDINSVVDSGQQKMGYYNEYGIGILLPEDISHDAYMQNKGRAGRKEPGIAIYTGTTEISELREEELSTVEIKVDEKKILTELLAGENIKNVLDKYLYTPNKQMLNFSFNWMKQAGLITKKEELTKYGYEVLKFPISVFNGRSILEAIELGVVDDIIPMVSIIEEKGFLKKEFNIKKFKNNFFDESYSDLEIYKKLYDILVSKEIEEDILKVFIGLGIEGSRINYFRSLSGTTTLIDVLTDEELDKIGIKAKNIKAIRKKIEKISQSLEHSKDYTKSKEKELNEEERKNAISKSLLAGRLHRLFSAGSKNKLEDFYGEIKIEFEKSDTSYVGVYEGQTYIGEPFIIGSEDKDDKEILSFLTRIEVGDIEELENRKYQKYIAKNKEELGKNIIIDNSGETFSYPKYLNDKISKQKYLAQNWLPYFLINKNNFFKSFLKTLKDSKKDIIISILSKITTKFYDKINPEYKEKSTSSFINDTQILELFVKEYNEENINKIEKSKKEHNVVVKKESALVEEVRVENEYKKTLKEAKEYIKNHLINTKELEQQELKNIIRYLEDNSQDYSRIILFLKNLNKNKQELKNSFIYLKRDNEALLKLKKRNSWIISFIDNLKDLKNGKNVSLSNLYIGGITDDKLLLSDPLIKKFDFINKSKKLKSDLQNLTKAFDKCDFSEKEKKYLLFNLQRFLFKDKRKFNRGKNNIDKFLNNLNINIENNNKQLDQLKSNNIISTEKNENIKKLNEENNAINNLVNKINIFKSNILNVIENIKSIDFNNIIWDKKNIIYTEKFLYNILITHIFNGDIISLENKSEEKLKEKARLYLNFENGQLEEFIEVLKNTVHLNENSEEINDKLKSKLDNYLEIINFKLDNNKNENEIFEKNIQDKYKNILKLVENIEGILSEIFNKNTLENNSNKIFNFVKKITSYSVYNIDEKILDLIKSIGLQNSNNLKIQSLFEYEELKEDIFNMDPNIEKFDSEKIENVQNDLQIEFNNINKGILDLEKYFMKNKNYILEEYFNELYSSYNIEDSILEFKLNLNEINLNSNDKKINLDILTGSLFNIEYLISFLKGKAKENRLNIGDDKIIEQLNNFFNNIKNSINILRDSYYIKNDKFIKGKTISIENQTKLIKQKTKEIKKIIEQY